MKILVDGTYLDAKKGTGMLRYLNNILAAWATMPDDNTYTVITRTKIAHPLQKDPRFKFVHLAPILSPKVFVWQNLDIPLFLRKEKFDVIFSPTYFVPLWGVNAPLVTVIYDVYYLAHPEWVPFVKYILMKFGTQRAATQSKAIICGSRYDKDQIVKYLKVSPETVKIIYGAPSKKFHKVEPGPAFREKYNLHGKTIVSCVGILFNRRHQDTVIQAFDLIAERRKDLQLLLIGANATYPYINFEQIISKTKNRDRILHITYLPEEEMLDMYNSSELLVYLSSHEGESFPMREALACGVPCLTTPMLNEVSGRAAVYVEDPANIESVSKGLLEALDKRSELSAIASSATSSRIWGDIALETLNCLKEATKKCT